MRPIYVFLTLLLITATACNNEKKEKSMDKEPISATSNSSPSKELEGTWEANYIMGAPKDFSEIYPHGAPKITFDLEKSTTSGNTGCNNFSAPLTINGNSIHFNEAMALTRKMCPDMTGETLFLDTLKKVSTFSISEQGQTLNLIIGDIGAMRFHKK